jgi:DNA-binding response OmpR family regulator
MMPRKQLEKAVVVSDPVVEQAATVLSVSPFEEDHVCLEHILTPRAWKVRGARTLREGLLFLHQDPSAIAIFEADLTVGRWSDALQALLLLPNPPAFIVASRLADHSLWIEVLEAGGYDVLAKPFQESEVARIVQLAWLERRYRCQRTSNLQFPARVVAAGA